MTATRRSDDLVADAYAAAIGDELRGKPFDRALLATVAELAGAGRGTATGGQLTRTDGSTGRST